MLIRLWYFTKHKVTYFNGGIFKFQNIIYLIFSYYSMEQITLISVCVSNLHTITTIQNKFVHCTNIT